MIEEKVRDIKIIAAIMAAHIYRMRDNKIFLFVSNIFCFIISFLVAVILSLVVVVLFLVIAVVTVFCVIAVLVMMSPFLLVKYIFKLLTKKS